jgi:hypothetical protein
MAKTKGGGPNPNKNIAQAEAILNSGGNTSNFTAATWEKLKEIERQNNAAAAPAVTQPQKSFENIPNLNPGGLIPSTSPTYSSPTTEAPAPPPAKPVDPWLKSSNYVAPVGIKQADPDIVLFDSESISPELLLELQYEDISGMELINISRSDIIDGQDVIYSPVKNLSSIRRRYNPNNIISSPELSSSFFSRFGIDLIQRGMNDPYFDEQGNLVIEIDDIKENEVIEVEIDTNGTIEEVNFI